VSDGSSGLGDDAKGRNNELPELAEVADVAELRLTAAVDIPEKKNSNCLNLFIIFIHLVKQSLYEFNLF
jgi:hypothetical protein